MYDVGMIFEWFLSLGSIPAYNTVLWLLILDHVMSMLPKGLARGVKLTVRFNESTNNDSPLHGRSKSLEDPISNLYGQM